MNQKYHNQICGLCGNFDGQPNDFIEKGKTCLQKCGMNDDQDDQEGPAPKKMYSSR